MYMSTPFFIDRTAARIEALTWRLKLAAVAAYALAWSQIYQLCA